MEYYYIKIDVYIVFLLKKPVWLTSCVFDNLSHVYEFDVMIGVIEDLHERGVSS